MKTEKCTVCGGKRNLTKNARKGVPYSCYECAKCGDVIFTMKQAEEYLTAAEKSKQVTFSKWGETLAVRIPAEIARRFKLAAKMKGRIIEEKDGFKVVPLPG